ncbi:transposase [Bradyrhizobium diazoefficiens]
MIIPAQGLRIVLAVRPVDFRCGHDALAGLVQNTLGLDPHSGLIVVFRSKRADRLKILLWDGTGSFWSTSALAAMVVSSGRRSATASCI